MTDDKEFGSGVPRNPKNRAAIPRKPSFALDPWVLVDGVVKRWYWMIIAAALLAVGAYFYTKHIWRNAYTASVQLIRFENQDQNARYKPRQLTDQTFASILKSPELLMRVATNAKPRLTPSSIASRVVISPVRESDVVIVMVKGMSVAETVGLANLYAEQATEFTKDLQRKDASAEVERLKAQLARLDSEADALSKRLAASAPPTPNQPGNRVAQLKKRIQETTDALDTLLLKYTDAHPLVEAKRAEKQALEKQLATEYGGLTPTGKDKEAREDDPETLRSALASLANSRTEWAARITETETYVTNAPGYCKLFAPATEKEVVVKRSEPQILFMTVAAGLCGFFGAICLALLVEIMDPRLKSPRDVSRVTELPVLATLGNLDKMSPAEQRSWAFKTCTRIQGKLSSSPNHGLVCGVTSSGTKEGRSTWVNMLAQAASECGFRVLTVATLPPNSPEFDGNQPALAAPNGKAHGALAGPRVNGNHDQALARSVLSSPMDVTEQLTGDDPQPMVHIPLPGCVWNLERRKQWQSALH